MIKKLRRHVLLLLVGLGAALPPLEGMAQTTPAIKATVESAGDPVSIKVIAGDYNGSAYTISGEVLREMAGVNLHNLLSGLLPGYYVSENPETMLSGTPNVIIRGSRTPNRGALILIDGQERDLNLLNVNEIEAVTILKDNLATALYGMRAGNGVILVTTRRGEVSAPKVDFTMKFINQRPMSLLEPVDAAQYASLNNQARKNDVLEPSYSQYAISNYAAGSGANREYYPNVDWVDKYLKESSWIQSYNMNITGGIAKARYFFNLGYDNQGGMFNTDNENDYSTNNRANCYNLRSNVDIDITKTTVLNIDMYGMMKKNTHPGVAAGSTNSFLAMMKTPALAFPDWIEDTGNYIDNNGNPVTGPHGKIISGNADNSNPWAMLNRAGYTNVNVTYGSFRGNVIQDLGLITPGLKLSALLSMDSHTKYSVVRTKKYAYYEHTAVSDVLRKTGDDASMVNNVADKTSVRRATIDGRISYDRTFCGLHDVSALVYYESFESATEVNIPARYQGVSGWFSYAFDKRYSIDATLSYQGGYQFAPGKKYGYFPAVAAGWNISNENFFDGAKDFMPYLKLRASYGRTGNTNGVDAFYYKGRLASQNNVYYVGAAMATALGGYLQDIFAYPNLTWEKSDLLNVGVDMKLFAGKLSLSGDVFRDDRTDCYVTNNRINSLAGSPVSDVKRNIGKMYSYGWDAVALWSDKVGEFHYNIGGNFMWQHSKVTSWGDVNEPYDWMRTTGQALGLQRGLVAEGFFNNADEIASAPRHTFSQVQPGDIRYKDINGDGQIDESDIVPIGYGSIPNIVYGITLNAGYKGFSLTAIFRGVGQMSRMMTDQVVHPFFEKGNIYKHQLNYWTPETAATATMPRLSTIHNGNLNNSRNNTLWMQKADYFKLANLELSYDLPESMFKRTFLGGVRVFVSGYNLFTVTDCKWIDPEADPAYASLPLTRNFSFGCSIKF